MDERTAGMEAVPGMTFGAVRAHIEQAVTYCLPASGPQEWRTKSPAELADSIATFAVAAIAPVVTNAATGDAVKIMRDMIADDEWLARNGLRRCLPEDAEAGR